MVHFSCKQLFTCSRLERVELIEYTHQEIILMNTDVLIVGAGPTGLTVANLLARLHINFRTIDAKAGPVNESRALVMQGRTLELLEKLDLADQAITTGQKMLAVDVLVNGKP